MPLTDLFKGRSPTFSQFQASNAMSWLDSVNTTTCREDEGRGRTPGGSSGVPVGTIVRMPCVGVTGYRKRAGSVPKGIHFTHHHLSHASATLGFEQTTTHTHGVESSTECCAYSMRGEFH